MNEPERGEVWLADLGLATKTRPVLVVSVPFAARICSRLEFTADLKHGAAMSSVQEIESALTRLSIADLQAVRDWLDDFLEDQMEVSDEFKAKVQRAKDEIAGGVYSRARQPETAP